MLVRGDGELGCNAPLLISVKEFQPANTALSSSSS